MKTIRLLMILFSTVALAQSGFHKNPIIYQPLTPETVAPGGPDLTLRVMGNGFDFESVVYWNDTPLATTVLGTRFVSAVVPAALTATAQTASIRVHNPKPFGGFSNTIFFGVTSPEASVSFAQTAYSGALDLVAGDFNGDGRLDLATNSKSRYVSVLLGNGDGTFRAPMLTALPCASGGIVTGDFNRDGIPDLAVGCADRISVLLGVGDGTFHHHQDYLVAQPDQLVAVDINQDGKLDLVFSNEQNHISMELFVAQCLSLENNWSLGQD